MSNEVEIVYFLITLLVGIFVIGQSSLFLFKHWKERLVREYLLLMGLLTIKIFTWLLFSYLEIFKNQLEGPPVLMLVSALSIFFTLWAFPRFIHSFFKISFGKYVNTVLLTVSLFFSIFAILGYFRIIDLPGLAAHFSFFSFLYFLMLIYLSVLSLVFCRRISDKVMGKVGLTMGIVLGLFAPAFALDFFLTGLIEQLILLTPLFYIIWNLLAFYFTIKYYQEKRIIGGTTGSVEFEGPPEEFYVRYNISSREREILVLLLKGHSNQEIGDLSFISLSTVKSHIYNVYRKVGVKNRIQLLAKVREAVSPNGM